MSQTQLEAARAGKVTEAMALVSQVEGVEPQKLRELVAAGRVAIPKNPAHTSLKPRGIGEGLSVKVNANIGTSSDRADMEEERQKLRAALEAKADAVMDLSTGGDLKALRKQVLDNSPVPVGTVPIYQAAVDITAQDRGIVDMTADELFSVIEAQAIEGVDFITVHCGVTRSALDRLRAEGRMTDIVSRGGSFLACWILANQEENPLYSQYDRLLEICRAHDVTLSLGDGLRPGCLADATDRAQITELVTLGELTERAWKAGVQVMIEGPGHVPLDQVQANVQIQKRVCHGAPFYVLGPLVTDIAAGHDHVACAIGGALAGWAGADFLCYVTPHRASGPARARRCVPGRGYHPHRGPRCGFGQGPGPVLEPRQGHGPGPAQHGLGNHDESVPGPAHGQGHPGEEHTGGGGRLYHVRPLLRG